MPQDRVIRMTVSPASRVIVVAANFSLGLTNRGRWEPNNVGFHLLNDHCTENGRNFVTNLMDGDDVAGWLTMTSDNAYGFKMTWHEMFKREDMVPVLTTALEQFYENFTLETLEG